MAGMFQSADSRALPGFCRTYAAAEDFAFIAVFRVAGRRSHVHGDVAGDLDHDKFLNDGAAVFDELISHGFAPSLPKASGIRGCSRM
jgi:hypothetical protein